MLIDSINIKNFRSIKEIDLNFDQYTALIGSNGTGKSSVLYALDWFFNDRKITEGDNYKEVISEQQIANDRDLNPSEITILFKDLSFKDKKYFSKYIDNDGKIKIRKTKKIEFEIQLFDQFEYAYTKGTLEPYRKLIKEFSLPELENSNKEDNLRNIRRELLLASNNNKNKKFFIDDVDDYQKFCSLIKFILIPAIPDIGELDSGKSSSINNLAKILNESYNIKKDEKVLNAENILLENDKIIAGQLNNDVGQQINEHLTRLIPNNKINIKSTIVRPDSSVKWEFNMEKTNTPLTQEGHGVQRAIIMALLQASKISHEASTILAIEEPELYQHPIRARLFADVLIKWVDEKEALNESNNRQLICATHSPHFILPNKITSIRLFSLEDNQTKITQTNLKKLAYLTNKNVVDVEKFLMKELPNQFSEAFFSSGVVLVEGDTDIFVLEGLASNSKNSEKSFLELGISILSVNGINNLAIPYTILKELNIPVYVIFDADHMVFSETLLADKEKEKERKEKETKQINSKQSALKNIKKQFHISDQQFNWGDPTLITKEWCIFKSDIEEELSFLSDFKIIWEKTEYYNKKDPFVKVLRDSKNVFKYRDKSSQIAIEKNGQFDQLLTAIKSILN